MYSVQTIFECLGFNIEAECVSRRIPSSGVAFANSYVTEVRGARGCLRLCRLIMWPVSSGITHCSPIFERWNDHNLLVDIGTVVAFDVHKV